MLQQRHRVRQILPGEGLLSKCEYIGSGALAYRGEENIEIGAASHRGEIPIPQRHVEGGMLAAHEAGGANTSDLIEDEWEQEQWRAVTVIGHDHERLKPGPRSDKLLPWTKEVEPLIWRGKVMMMFQPSPDGFGLGKVGKNVDGGDAA
jgi:hypothetical protein